MGSLLLVRADANPHIGVGHVMRSLAIAQAWQDAGGKCVFAMAHDTLAPRLEGEGMRVVHLGESPEDLASVVSGLEPRAVVLDGYGFGVPHQEAAKHRGARTLLIDDGGATGSCVTDLLLDPNVAATAHPYDSRRKQKRNPEVLLGPRFALLRREFLACAPRPREERHVLVSFGGADPAALSGRAIEALEGLHVTLLIGAANPSRDRLKRAAERARMRVLYDATNMPELMASATLAVVAAGSTCTELAFMGVPTLAAITAENQRMVVAGFESIGSLRSLGEANDLTAESMRRAVLHLLADAPQRAAMSKAGPAVIDGLGARRVVEALT